MTDEATKQDKYADGTEHIYLARTAPFLKTRIEVDEKDVYLKFKDGKLVLNGPHAKIFDEIIASGAGVARMVQKVDRDAALAMVNEDFKRRQAAQRGPATSALKDAMRSQEMKGSTKSLSEMAPNNPEALEQFRKDVGGEFLPTEPVQQPTVVADNSEAPIKL